MSLNSPIKYLFVFMICALGQAQNDSIVSKNKTSKYPFLYDNDRQKSIAFTAAYQLPITTGTNFIGNGYEGKGGLNLGLQVFLYKQFYTSYTFGQQRFEVKNQQILGVFSSSRVTEHVLNFGYEFLPLKKVRLGVNFGFGDISFSNRINNTVDRFRDTGNLTTFGFYTNYELSNEIGLHLAYNFKNVNTDIATPQSLNSTFENGRYNTLNFGITISVGDSNAVEAILNSYKKKK